VLQKLQDTNLQAKIKKYKFYIQEIEFLGHKITIEGIKIDKAKV
jgi:hypothetical protein